MPIYDKLPDIELVVLLKQGDEGAFTQIYNRYWEKLFAISYSYCKQKHIAEEIVQDIFMRIWDNRNLSDIHSLSSYLATAAKFSVFNYLSKTKRQLELLKQNIALNPHVSEEDNINSRFLKDYIEGIVETLPEKCRLVFRYSREQQLSINEISKQMRISPKTVESHLSKALKTLRLSIKHIRLWTIPEAFIITGLSFLLYY